MEKKVLFVISFILLQAMCSSAGLCQQIPTTNLVIKDGMSSYYITDITQDKNGFMWFASKYGLNRFDGKNITIFLKESGKNSINSNIIIRVAADTTNNRIWIANSWDGLNVYDCETELFSSFTHNEEDDNSLISNNIRDIAVTPVGDVWIATDHGADFYDSTKNRFFHYNQSTVSSLPSNNINAIAIGASGNIYLGYNSNGFSIFSPEDGRIKHFKGSETERDSLSGSTVHAIFPDTNDKVWLGTDHGLTLLDPTNEKFQNFYDIEMVHPSIKGNVYSVTKTSDGRIYAGTSSCLCYFHETETDMILNGSKDVNHTYIQDFYEGITNPGVFSIFEDSFNNVWIGSSGGGASFIDSASSFFHNWRINKIPGTVNGLNDKEVMTICVADDGCIWMGTDGGGLNVNRNGLNDIFYSKDTDSVSSNAYFSSLQDSDNNLWFGTYAGIDIYLNQDKEFIHYTPQGSFDVIRCLFEDNKRNIWIGSSAGLEIYNLDSKQKTFINSGNSGLPDSEINAVSQDKYNIMWIGTLNEGVFTYDPQSKCMDAINREALFGTSPINQLFRDSKDNIWAATSDGLTMFRDGNPNDYKQFTTKNGLNCNNICSIIEDYDNNIWLSTYFGISCIIKGEEDILNFNHLDGALFGNYMNNSVGKDRNGNIYFGSINGVCYFNPDDRPKNIKLPPIIFTEFRTYGDKKCEDGVGISLPVGKRSISLSHNENIFSVSFSSMNKSLQGKVEYAYRLEGLNNVWINLKDENQVTFRNIPYGKYKLHVKGRYKNQQWQDNYSTMEIIVNPPIWLTWWAKIIYALCTLAAGAFIIISYKKRMQLNNSLYLEKENAKKQKELNEERLRFYTNITHELKTPLTLILGPLEDLQSDVTIQKEQMKKISLIHKSTLRLMNLVTQILEFRKVETQNKKLCVVYGDIAEKIQEIGLKYKALNRNADVVFDIHINTDMRKIYFDPEVVSIILDNLLSNAFKYTYQGNITLTLQNVVTNNINYTVIDVSDTGIGIPEKDLPYIFERYYQSNKNKNTQGFGIGLALVKNLVDLHEATISVDSKQNSGTTFQLRFVTDNSYPNAIHAYIKSEEIIDEEITNKPLVLIVEDEKDMRDYMAESLINDFEIIVAENGETGYQAAFNSIPDIIISDIMMPIKDGIELCKEVKSNMATSHIPVILLTAKDTSSDKKEGYDAGADSYVTKPFSASLLKSRINNILDNRKKIALLISSNTSMKHSIFKESLNIIDNEFIENFIKIIEENLIDEKIDIPSIAHELSMSYSSLYRKIKALTGMSAGEFIRKLRIRKAEQLLLSGKYNVTEVAHQVGLNSASYFRECFKEEFGVSPSEYIKKLYQ